jgi:hypothetical protein
MYRVFAIKGIFKVKMPITEDATLAKKVNFEKTAIGK